MGSIHNTRILRFLLVLCAVVLTIFIYASYSSNTSLSPAHMRVAGSPSAMSASAALSSSVGNIEQTNTNSNINQQQQQQQQQQSYVAALIKNYNKSNEANFYAENKSPNKYKLNGSNGSNGYSHNSIQTNGNDKHYKKDNQISAAAVAAAAGASPYIFKKQHYREPTIDEDAGGGGGGGGSASAAAADGSGIERSVDVKAAMNSLDAAVPDETALERFANNELLDEQQYGQNIDNTLGNINNLSVVSIVQTQKQLQQQQQQLIQQQQQDGKEQDQQQHIQIVDNNFNKILDSDVLIPTSNLQKFIENADKILKNITAIPPAAPVPVVATATATASVSASVSAPAIGAPVTLIKSTDKSSVKSKVLEKKSSQQSPSVIVKTNPSEENKSKNVADANDNSEALPPSVVMAIKRTGAVPESAVAITTKTNAVTNNKSKISPKTNSTTVRAAVDPTQGIPTEQIYEHGHINEEIDIEKICPNGGADLKLLILITSAQGHAEARLAIRQTWGHYGTRRDVSIAFMLGSNTNETLNLALTHENFIYGDLIRGHFVDSYNNLTLKTISALEWVDEHCSRAKYLLKTDDDMFINVPKLLAFLDGHSKEKRVIYGRLAKKWKPIRNKKSKYYVSTGQFGAPVFPPFNTGPAYVMTTDIVHELYTRSLHQVYLKLEDVFTTGIVAQQLGIKRVHVNEFLNRRIAFNPCNIRKSISVHMIKANEQFDLWKKLLDQTTKCK
ncbi:myb-like protein P [Teleopsis dalmanni]|uniref:myb-like protein P n=1 Tax=Teleopsis dalmanni TaxID=139649 RepID=UPI0018CDDD03|nr:myb-like protein P [Teleopsis dalmanni]